MKTKTIKAIVLALGLVACAGAMAHTVTVDTTDGKGNIYNEGDQATFRVTLSYLNDTGGTIYAFLKASDNAVAGMFSGSPLFVVCNDTDLTKTRGLAINDAQISTTESKIKLLDGLSQDAGGLSLTFEVVLCTTPQYSAVSQIAGYDSNYLNVTVYNAEPIIKRIEMNGFESECDGYQFDMVPVGMWQEFQAVVADKGAYDLETNFKTKWTVSRNGQQKGSCEVVGNPNDDANAYSNNFTQAGTWVVKCQVKDKDMDDWSEASYSVSFVVLDHPNVTIDAEESYLENDSGAKFEVGLGYFYSADDIVVKLTVTPPSGTNPGALKLDSKFKTVPAGYPALAENEYYVSFDSAQAISVGIEEMDGTMLSSIRGFTVTAAVVSNGMSVDPSMTWAEYYRPYQTRIYVNNVIPVLGTVTQENENAWVIVSGVASSYPIRWQIRNDVAADFAAGVKVRFDGCDNAFTTNVTDAAKDVFVPDFGAWLGPQLVTMTIEDKDGGYIVYTYRYEVLPQRYSATVDGVAWIYELCDAEKARIVGTGTMLTGNVTIPSELDGNVVVALAETALKNAHGVTGIVIPKSVVQIEDGAFSGLEEVLAQWYKSLAELVDGGTSYGLGENVADKTVASITVSDDATLGDFVLAKDKVYDSVVHIVNTADHEIRIILPEGYSYRVLKGSRPLTVPAHSECVLTITRLSAQIFLVTVAELEVLQ